MALYRASGGDEEKHIASDVGDASPDRSGPALDDCGWLSVWPVGLRISCSFRPGTPASDPRPGYGCSVVCGVLYPRRAAPTKELRQSGRSSSGRTTSFTSGTAARDEKQDAPTAFSQQTRPVPEGIVPLTAPSTDASSLCTGPGAFRRGLIDLRHPGDWPSGGFSMDSAATLPLFGEPCPERVWPCRVSHAPGCRPARPCLGDEQSAWHEGGARCSHRANASSSSITASSPPFPRWAMAANGAITRLQAWSRSPSSPHASATRAQRVSTPSSPAPATT